MKTIFFIMLSLLSFLINQATISAAVTVPEANNVDIQSIEFLSEGLVLINIDGKWWWVTYNEDGSIKNQIPADFWVELKKAILKRLTNYCYVLKEKITSGSFVGSDFTDLVLNVCLQELKDVLIMFPVNLNKG